MCTQTLKQSNLTAQSPRATAAHQARPINNVCTQDIRSSSARAHKHTQTITSGDRRARTLALYSVHRRGDKLSVLESLPTSGIDLFLICEAYIKYTMHTSIIMRGRIPLAPCDKLSTVSIVSFPLGAHRMGFCKNDVLESICIMPSPIDRIMAKRQRKRVIFVQRTSKMHTLTEFVIESVID